MKKLLILCLVLSGCMNIPKDQIATTSNQKLCNHSNYDFVSEENREEMRKELDRRGLTCTKEPNYEPPPEPYQRKSPTRTNCQKIGNQVNCTTY